MEHGERLSASAPAGPVRTCVHSFVVRLGLDLREPVAPLADDLVLSCPARPPRSARTRYACQMDSEEFRNFVSAVMDDRPEASRLLEAKPILLEARGLWEETPLHYVAVEDSLEGVRFLAGLGASVNTSDDGGTPVLIDAINVASFPVVQFLLEAGANPNATSLDFGCALAAAINRERSDVVELLLVKGADPTALEAIPGPITLGSTPAQARALAEILTRVGLKGSLNPSGAMWIPDSAADSSRHSSRT